MREPPRLSMISAGAREAAVPATNDIEMPTPNSSCRTTAVTGRTASLKPDMAMLRHIWTPPRIRPIVPSSKTSEPPVSITPTANTSPHDTLPLISGK